MITVVLIFVLIGLAAAAFAVLPLILRPPNVPAAQEDYVPPRRRPVLAIIAALVILLLGLGTYGFLGQPHLAERSLHAPNETDYPALIATLAERIRERPGDVEGWVLLGRGYLALNDSANAVKALSRAISLMSDEGRRAPPFLLSAYGVALAEQSGSVTPEAEEVFRQALAQDPADLDSRYYLGYAAMQRGDRPMALSLWESLLADAPQDAPFRPLLVDQVAALKASSGGGGPDIAAMVAGLAARLEKNPRDLEGWQRLVRAYSVLGETVKAQEALAKARAVFADDAAALKALVPPSGG
jgi:cytochrome c-type biogenesis protein CcmH